MSKVSSWRASRAADRRASSLVLTVLAVLALLVGLTGCGSGAGGPGSAGAPDLPTLVPGSREPVYYLGPAYGGLALEDQVADERVVAAMYGSCSASDSSCSPPLQVQTFGFDPSAWRAAAGCERLADVRGVPAVHVGDQLQLFTSDSVVAIGLLPDDVARSRRAAQQLRLVGASGPAGPLPPPTAEVGRLVDASCGAHPGEHGPIALDEAAGSSGWDEVADFTVARLGGGQLRWADYLGRPVVVVVGDVSQVSAAVRELAALRADRTPAVIGLVWEPFGDKSSATGIEEIEASAGTLPVPVGFAAVPRPAVWFIDASQISPELGGVVAYIDARGRPVRFLGTTASREQLREALTTLH